MRWKIDHRVSIALASVVCCMVPGRASEPQVPPEYVAAVARLRAAGRQVADWCIAGNAEALFDRFGAAMRAAVSKADLRDGLEVLRTAGPIGTRRLEAVLPFDPDNGAYLADHDFADGMLRIAASFDRQGGIRLFSAAPEEPLPPDPHEEYATVAHLRLPFDGDWWVVWGGRTRLQNYHVVAADQRHAYDFLVWRDGATYRDGGTRNEEYWAWGRSVLAPGTATVLAVRDGVRDNRPKIQINNAADPAGNHVVLDFGTGEYALIAHFQQGSLRVKVGDRVQPGQLLGLCGNSGNSSEPHVHIHLQDRPELFRGTLGLPLAFTGYLADGERVERGEPVQGQFVRHLE
jgi:murein DD-endopeptidase MepM/ murein hydrolase activator NlpD